MVYEDIVGQEKAKERLRAMVTEQRIPHAMLFTGKDGGGNLPAALVFVQHLFCSSKTPAGPCNACAGCTKISKLSHPDLHLVFPVIKSKQVGSSDDLLPDFRAALLENPYLTANQWSETMDAGNKQPVIPVEEASNILRKLSYTSYEGTYKVMLVWQPEKMNLECANRLLKILEEPPEQTIFILVTAQPGQLLTTILSRVQQIPFYNCSETEIGDALVERFQVSREAAAQAALLSDGCYGEAVRALRQSDGTGSFLINFQNFMRLAVKYDCARLLKWIDENAAAGREKQKQFIQYALQVFRDSLMYNYGDQSLVKLNGEERSFLSKFAPFISLNNYQRLVEEFNTSYYHIERNANPRILFMDLYFNASSLLHAR